jgi:hypothetical protein
MPLTKIQSLGITDGTIAAADIASGAITAAKLAAGVGGKVLQVVSSSVTVNDTTTSDTFQTSSLSASITPSSTSNKVFVIVSSRAGCSIGDRGPRYAIFRGSTNITGSTSTEGMSVFQANGQTIQPLSITVLDSPSTTSSTTYSLRWRAQDGTSETNYCNSATGKSTITLLEIAG